ncbi:MAG: hypothetical protein IT285_04305, partial [Bdellovibrionales bacterium]|nr:hypothetical protein [Bdellovibrionales bacterium]
FGTPILAVNEQVLREALSLEQAVEIFRAQSYAGSWSIHLSSAKERRAVSVEVSADGVEALWAPAATLAAANHVRGGLAIPKEFSFSQRYFEDSRLRARAMEKGLSAAGAEGLSLEKAVQLISGVERVGADGQSEVRSVHGIVSKLNNIQSVVMAPEAGIALMGVPRDIGGKPTQGIYHAVPLAWPGALEPELFLSAARRMAPGGVAGSAVPESTVRAHEAVRHAAHAAADEGDFGTVVRELEEAVAEEPREVTWKVLRAVSGFRWAADAEDDASKRARLNDAFSWLERASEQKPDGYVRSLIALFRGRYRDLMGEREAALLEYAQVSGAHSVELRHQAELHLRKPYRARALRKLVIDTVHGDIYRF